MKLFALIAAALLPTPLFFLSCAHAHEIATVTGRPDASRPFVRELVRERISISHPKAFEREISTAIYSIFSRKGVKSAASIEILDDAGNSTQALLHDGIRAAAARAPVVLTNLGPIESATCQLLGMQLHTAFVVVAGSNASVLDASERPDCLARNILFVSALDQTTGKLESFANYGSLVRVASPSHRILAIAPSGRSERYTNTSMGSALVAARLAVYARSHPTLEGADLIQRFLEDAAVRLPSLEGKIEGALALDDSGL